MASAGAAPTRSRRELTEGEVENSLYDPWRHAYTPRPFEVVRVMTFGNGPAVVLSVDLRRREAVLAPLLDTEFARRFVRRREPFSMIRKYYDQSGRRRKVLDQ